MRLRDSRKRASVVQDANAPDPPGRIEEELVTLDPIFRQNQRPRGDSPRAGRSSGKHQEIVGWNPTRGCSQCRRNPNNEASEIIKEELG